MNSDELRARFSGLNVWKKHGERALNKPLLVLWAIGRCLRSEDRMASWRDIELALTKLLTRFGPPGTTPRPDYPFWRLRNDGLWKVKPRSPAPITESPSGHAYATSLRDADAHGGFPKDVFVALQSDTGLAIEIAHMLVNTHFPPTQRDDVLRAVGITSGPALYPMHTYQGKAATSRFSKEVLEAYQHRCAVCGYAVHSGGTPLGLAGVHIMSPGAKGPDEVNNGLGLCALHHALFDAGAFTLGADRRITVAAPITGAGVHDALGRYNSREALVPESDMERPAERFLAWHRREVFISTGTSLT